MLLAGAPKVIYQFRRFFSGRNEAFPAVLCVWCRQIKVWRLAGAPWSSLALSLASLLPLRSLALPGVPPGVPWRSLPLPGAPWHAATLPGAPRSFLALLGVFGFCCSLVFRSARRRSLVLLAFLFIFWRSQALRSAPWRSLAFSGVPLPWAPCLY